MSIDLWRKRHDFKLSEAALLLAGHDPDKFSDEQLLTKPPERFKAIYGALLSDAVAVIDEAVQSEEDPDAYYTLYALMTDKSPNSKKLTDHDGLVVRVDRLALEEWAAQRGFGLGSLDCTTDSAQGSELSDDERRSLHRIIGALKQVILDGQKEEFKTQTDLLTHLTIQYQGYRGLGKTKVEEVFAEANRLLKEL